MLQSWYLYLITARWFGMRIDILNAIFLTVVVFVSVPLAMSKPRACHSWNMICTPLVSGLNPALVGLSLTYIISLAGLLQYAVRQSTEVESIVSLNFMCYQ